MNTEKKTLERLLITLALLSCIGFSAFLLWLQHKQEADREQLSGQREETQAEQIQGTYDQPVQIRTRLTADPSGEQPVFSLPGGFYPEEITVEITAPEGCRVYYTTDGTKPGEDNGTLYEGPVEVANVCGSPNVYSAVSTVSAYQNYAPLTTVDKAVVLQAVAVDADGMESAVTCASYFIAMEGKAMYRSLPVLSVTTEPAGLFDYFEGIYVTGVDYENALASDELRFDSANYYRGGEISAHIEYFETDRYLTYEGDVTLTLCKDGNLDYGQKSFLFTEAEPVIDDTCELYPYFRNGTMVLYGGGTDHAMKSRQCLEEELLRGRAQGFLSEAMSGCMVFVDGEFWGLYLMREAIRPESLAERAGCRVEEIRMVENAYPSQIAPEYGELYRLVTEQNAGSEKIYGQILEQMDVDSFLEYYCANLYFGNPKFDSFSTTVWRQEGEDSIGKWHWEFTDATDTLGRNSLSNYSVNTYLCPQVAGDLFFQGLLKNPDFEESFRRRMQAYAEEWTREQVEEALTPILEKYRVAVTVTAQRYGVQQTEEGYLADGDTILTYFDRRGEYILRYTQELLHRNAETE